MQVFANKEKIGILSKTGNTTVQLSSSVITLGARQYTTGNLVCDTSISGVGGLDIGIIAPSETYNIYAVIQSGSVALVFSLANSPVGFSKYKKLGEMRTNGSSQIYEVINLGEVFSNRFERKALTANVTTSTTNIGELAFNNLIIGKTYVIGGQANARPSTSGDCYINFIHNGVTIGRVGSSNHGGQTVGNGFFGINVTFEATVTTLTVDAIVNSAVGIIGGAADTTWLTLEEKNTTRQVV